MKKSKLGLLFLSSLALVTGVASTGVAGPLFSNFSVSLAKAESVVEYTLSTTKSTANTAYATYYDVTVGGIQWNVPGNQNFDGYWRIGGKSLSNVDRTLTSKQIVSTKNITSVVLNHKGLSNSSFSVNSVKLEVSSDAGFSTIISTVTPAASFSAGKTDSVTFTRPASDDWSNRYFRITLNVSNSTTSNYGLNLTSIQFYAEDVKDNPTAYFNTQGGNQIEPQEMSESNSVVVRPSDPVKAGYVFDDWYTTSDGDTKYVFGSTITENTTIFAHWNLLPITNINAVVSGEYSRVTGTVVAKSGSDLYIQDSTGAIQYHADSDSTIASINTGYVITLTANTITYKDTIIEMSGAPIGDIAINDSSSRDVSRNVTPITSYDETTASEEYAKYIKLNRLLLSSDISSGTVVEAKTFDGQYTIKLFGQSSNMRVSTGLSAKAGTYVDVTGAIINYNGDTPEIVLETIVESTMYTATYHLNGGTILEFSGTQTIFSGDKFVNPGVPEKQYDQNGTYTFDGWYSDAACTTPFDFNSEVVSNVDVYAKYTVGTLPANAAIEYASTMASLSYRYNKTQSTEDVVKSYSESVSANSSTCVSNLIESDSYTVSFEAGTYTQSVSPQNSYLRFYAGNKMTVSLSEQNAKRIEKIVVTCTSGYAKGASAVCKDLDDVAASVKTTNTTITITPDADKNAKVIEITNTDSAQSRISSIEVTYQKPTTVTVDNWEFNNTAIRFGGLVKKSIWNDLGDITDYGVMLAKTSDLGTFSIAELFEGSDGNLDELASCGVKTFNSNIAKDGLPATALESQLTDDMKGLDYYVFNAYVSVPESHLKTSLSAVAYIVTDGQYKFLKQKECSVKTLADSYVETLGNEVYEGSLKALSDKLA